MNFLMLTICVCTASAAAPRYRPQAGTFAPSVASASAVISNPKPVAKSSSNNDVEAEVLRSDIDVSPEGFAYTYETGNGISADATGTLRNVDKIDALVFQGSYQYVGPDGTPVRVEYVADENGYQPKSDVLPVPPPIPVAIARALEYIAAHPPAVKEIY